MCRAPVEVFDYVSFRHDYALPLDRSDDELDEYIQDNLLEVQDYCRTETCPSTQFEFKAMEGQELASYSNSELQMWRELANTKS